MTKIVFDFREYETIEEFHEDVIQKLALTDYYGKNLDAFNDELSNLSKTKCEVKRYDRKFFCKFDRLLYKN